MQAIDDDEGLLGYLLNAARKIAAQEQLNDGYRIVINDGRHGSQSVYHLHLHILYVHRLARSCSEETDQCALYCCAAGAGASWVGPRASRRLHFVTLSY